MRLNDATAKAELEGPALPPAVAYLADWFLSLAGGRSNNGYGPDPISSTEMAAWAELNGRRLTAWEAQALRAMDQAWLADPNDKPKGTM